MPHGTCFSTGFIAPMAMHRSVSGGRIERNRHNGQLETPLETALRETEEEIGVGFRLNGSGEEATSDEMLNVGAQNNTRATIFTAMEHMTRWVQTVCLRHGRWA